jgi:hypothetical protein
MLPPAVQVVLAVAVLQFMVLVVMVYLGKALRGVTHLPPTKVAATLALVAVVAHKAKVGTEIVFHLPTGPAVAVKVHNTLLTVRLNFMQRAVQVLVFTLTPVQMVSAAVYTAGQ